MPYSPASINSTTLATTQAVYYEKMGIANLKATTPGLAMTKSKPLPLNSGNQIKFYTYSLLAANTNQAAEGTVGSPITESQTTITATIGQYADFINCSDLSIDVAYDDPGLLQSLAVELNYRLALTLNNLVLLTADAANSVDSSVNITLANGSYLTANNFRSAAQSLYGVNARPLTTDGKLGCLIPPQVVRDVFNDSTPNGLTDILKRQPDTQKLLLEPLVNDDVFEFAGIRFRQTTTPSTTTINGLTAYQSYLFADDAIFSVFLGDSPTESDKQNYRLNVVYAPKGGAVSDPAGMIGGWVSYNMRYTNTLRPGSVMTLRKLIAQTSSS